MKKKILIGSIGAVLLIILAGFTSVIGSSQKEINLKDSPLYEIRKYGYIKSKEKLLTTASYVGNGQNLNILQISKMETTDIEKILNIICNMDENEFNKFSSLVISDLIKNEDLAQKDSPEIINSLNYIRANPEDVKLSLNDGLATTGIDCTYRHMCPTSPGQGPLCNLRALIILLLSPIIIPVLVIIVVTSEIITALFRCN